MSRIIIAQDNETRVLQTPFALHGDPAAIRLMGEALIAAAQEMEDLGTAYGWARLDNYAPKFPVAPQQRRQSPWRLDDKSQ